MATQADSLKVKYTFYVWESKERIYLTDFGSLERQFPEPVFWRVEIDKNTSSIVIEGFINHSGLKTDTFGLCCFDVIIAKAEKGGKLSNIRRHGKTQLASDSGNNSRRDGFFRCKVKLNPKDVLLIGNAGTTYWGAALIPIGELLKNSGLRTTAVLQSSAEVINLDCIPLLSFCT